jgi:hypothetical protein
MNHMFLIVLDRGGGVFLVIALAMLVVSLVSLPFMPLFRYTQNERLKRFGGSLYGFLGIATMASGFMFIPASLLVIVMAGVVRYRGTGTPKSLMSFALGCVIWLGGPLVFIVLGRFQVWFSKRLAPILWDKKLRTAERRRKAALRRSRTAP